jgi:hypothetical protein
MKYEIELIVGDWSCDGHEKSENFIVRCSLSKNQLEKAYKAAVKRIGLDPSEDLARDYEDHKFPREYFDKLVAAGIMITSDDFDHDGADDADDTTCDFRFGTDTFVDLYMKVAQSENSQLTYEHVTPPSIHIGGYGLFY